MTSKTKRRRTRKKPAPARLVEPRRASAEHQARVDRFARAFAHILLVKLEPEAARRMAEEPVPQGELT
jgi:hypothetical protein